ncbi:Uncharacterised protein [Segatella copri]|nr:Uncharacterised protein [Segatella copri]
MHHQGEIGYYLICQFTVIFILCSVMSDMNIRQFNALIYIQSVILTFKIFLTSFSLIQKFDFIISIALFK